MSEDEEKARAEHEKQVMAEAMSRRKGAEDRVRFRQAKIALKEDAEEARDRLDIARARALGASKPEPREGTLTDAIRQAHGKLFPNGEPPQAKTRNREEQLRIRVRNDAVNKEIESLGFEIPNLAKDVKARDVAINRALNP